MYTRSTRSEDEMKSHLLLVHMEGDTCCPFCTISGLTYDELSYHINAAHSDTLEPWSSDEDEPGEIQILNSSNLESPQTNMKDSISHTEQKNYTPRLPANSEQNNNTQQSTEIECIEIEESDVLGGSRGACSAGYVGPEQCNTKFINNTNKETEYQAYACARNIDYNEATVLDCPFCSEIKTSVEELELHVKVEHSALIDTPTKGFVSNVQHWLNITVAYITEEHGWLKIPHGQEVPDTSRQQFECPMCSLICASFQILQEHVNLHLEESIPNEASSDDISKDLLLARQLQAEEDKKSRAEESEKEKEEFQKLQKLFGLDDSGGYRQQSVQSLEKAVARGRLNPMEYHLHKAEMMESIATGLEDGRTKTSGILEALRQYYNNAAPEVNRVWLCSSLDHFSNAAGDKGWGCGFRNFQMVLSSILTSNSYRNYLQDYRYIPCIPKIQALIENAWKKGFDPQGASHFGGRLQGTKAWIGACEIYCLLTSLHVKSRIIDFHKPSSSSGTHPLLFEWVLNYYSSDAHSAGKVVCSTKPAIYLQHQGHSRTIVGIEERKNKSYCLLIFDPGHPPESLQRLTKHDLDNAAMKHLRKHLTGLKHKQYQIVAVEGALSNEEMAVRLQMSKTFKAERIP